MTHIAAIDLGTTTARAGVFDGSGQRVAVARTTLDTTHPFPGAVEQDPRRFVEVVVELLHRALSDAVVAPSEVAALGIANQRATIVAWDAESGPLRSAIGWQDTRTAARCAEFAAQGIPLTTSASCSKLQWLMETDAAVEAAARRGTLRLGTVDSWLTWALSDGGAHVTDPSNAGATGLLDLRSGEWSDGALGLFGVPREPLGEVVGSDAIVGVTSAAVLGAEIPLAARAGDQQAACIAHALAPGESKLTLGTSAMLDLAIGATPGEAPGGCYTLPLSRRAGADEFMIEGSVQTAGAAMEWLVRIGVLPSVSDIDALAAAGQPGVTFVPALAGLGSPTQDPDARGLLAGLDLGTGPPEIVRGALEGVAARVADLTETMAVNGPLRVDGGLSQSSVLLAAIADATGLDVLPAVDPETTLRGAAMLAAGAVDADPIPPVALRSAVTPRTTEPERTRRRAEHEPFLDVARGAARDPHVV